MKRQYFEMNEWYERNKIKMNDIWSNKIMEYLLVSKTTTTTFFFQYKLCIFCWILSAEKNFNIIHSIWHFEAFYCYCKNKNIQVDVEFIYSNLLTFNHLITYWKICATTKYLKRNFVYCSKRIPFPQGKIYSIWEISIKSKANIHLKIECTFCECKYVYGSQFEAHILFWQVKWTK